MKNLQLWLITIVLLSALNLLADTYPKNPNVDVLHYVFRLQLSDATDDIKGETTVDVRFLTEGQKGFYLDLIGRSSEDPSKGMAISGIVSGDKTIRYSHKADRIYIELQSPSRTNERRSYTITYSGVPADGLVIADNKFGERTFSADNWPNKVRYWLPTMDHPADKATCEFIITAPEHYQVIANGLRMEETNLPDRMRLTHWKQSVPICSWLMVISVSRYAVQYLGEYRGISVQTWVFPQNRDEGFYDFANAIRPLEFFDTHVGPYAYEKLANVQVRAPVGATEAATTIFYNERFVTGERKRENTIAHETAHHWFGNAVTENDWNHVWLSEGFATYFTLLFVEYAYGRDRFLAGLERSKQRVLRFYQENPNYRIVHENLSDMSKVTSSQTYQKGGWTLHMLRGIMGDENFWKGIRAYYEEFNGKNASTDDFRRVMEEACGQELSWFFHQWLYQGGTLKYQGGWKYDEGASELNITLNQVQNDGTSFKMPVQLGIYQADQSEPRIETLQVNNLKNTFTISLPEAPESVKLDPETWVLMEADFGKN